MQSFNYNYSMMDTTGLIHVLRIRIVTNLSDVYIRYYGCLFTRENEMIIIAMLSFGLRSMALSIIIAISRFRILSLAYSYYESQQLFYSV